MNFSSYIWQTLVQAGAGSWHAGQAKAKGGAAMRPFEGIRVIDVTHVLAGPFAAYQLAVLGADVIKVDDPNDPDQSRSSGTDKELNRRQMGTGFLTQASN